MARLIGLSRFIVTLGVLSSIVVSLFLFVAVTIRTGRLIIEEIPRIGLGSEEGTKTLVVAAIEQADTVLIAAALLIIGIGLYELFIGQIKNVPHWLEVTTLDDLKEKLISLIVAVLAVNFFIYVAEWDGGGNILALGLGIGAVVLSLASFNFIKIASKGPEKAIAKKDDGSPQPPSQTA